MRVEQGVMLWYDPDGCEAVQRETFTCPHDQTVGFVGQDDGGWCFKCKRLLCKNPACYEDCTPIAAMSGAGDDRKLERILARR